MVSCQKVLGFKEKKTDQFNTLTVQNKGAESRMVALGGQRL